MPTEAVATTAVSQYEALRRAALGEPVAPHERSGLVVFLRRGMWSWAQSVSSAVSPRTPTPVASGRTTSTDHSAIVPLLVAMALSVERERAL